jgi:Sec-independent protein translocase protein TatA
MDPLTVILLALAAIVLFGAVRRIPGLIISIRDAVERFRNIGNPPDGPVDEPFEPRDEPFDPDRRA